MNPPVHEVLDLHDEVQNHHRTKYRRTPPSEWKPNARADLAVRIEDLGDQSRERSD